MMLTFSFWVYYLFNFKTEQSKLKIDIGLAWEKVKCEGFYYYY